MNLSNFIDKLLRFERKTALSTQYKVELPVYVVHRGFSYYIDSLTVEVNDKTIEGVLEGVDSDEHYIEIRLRD